MRKLKNSRKILSLLLLGSFFMSLLILPDISNTTNPISPQKSLTRDNFIPEQKSPIQDDNPPKASAPDSYPIFNQTFNISQSEDDAFGDNNYLAFPATFYDTTNITLGIYDLNGPNVLLSNQIALRWNITVPKYARITKAYINLTVANLTSFGVQWTGFNTSIRAFNEASTNDFSDPNEALGLMRPIIGNFPWELNGTEKINQTLQTINIADLLEQIMEIDGWDGIFGAYILAEMGTEDNEAIQFWSYDYGKPEYCPKLFVEWQNILLFKDTPEDMYVIEKNPGYSLKWNIGGNNPDTFKVTCNVSIPGIPHYDTWTSGWVTYDLPALEKGFYNFTVYFNDTDGNLIWDSVIVEAGKPQGIYKIDRSEDDAWYKPQVYAFAESGINLQLGGSTTKTNAYQRITCLRFNTAVPKNVRIKRAYVNLTIASVTSYNGFTSKIYLFYPQVADFTDDNDLFTLPPIWMELRPASKSPVDIILPESLSAYDTIQTPELNSSLQKIIDFGSYNGYIGLYIIPTVGVDSIYEKVNFFSYDFGNPEYTPTLFVEWEESPYFLSTPADITAKNGTRGYHLDWTVTDDNPTNFNITCNRTVSNIPYHGVWQSGVENFYNWIHMEVESSTTKIRYDLPPLDIGVYNFTICVNDAYGNYKLDSVIVNVTDLDLHVIDVKFVQNGEEVDYFQCGNGPFTLRIYTSPVNEPGVWLTAYYPGYNQRIYADLLSNYVTGVPVDIYITGDTTLTRKYDDSYFSYNFYLGCYEFTCPSFDTYYWELNKWQCVLGGQYEPVDKIIQNIEYNLLNRFEIRVNSGVEYIYNQTIYGGIWTRPLEVWNNDLTSPTYSEPEFIEPDEPDKHYEVNIWAASEEFGAKIDDVFLYYSVDDGPWEECKMVLKDGKYYGEIPSQIEGATIDYYIRITDIAGNIIETDEYHEKAPNFEEPSVLIPILGILLGILGSLSIVAIYRHKSKIALKKHPSEKSPKKAKKGTKIGNKLLQKIKKVRKKQ